MGLGIISLVILCTQKTKLFFSHHIGLHGIRNVFHFAGIYGWFVGIGKELQVITQSQLGPHCTLILIAAPAAHSYYEHIGFTHNVRCSVLERNARIKR